MYTLLVLQLLFANTRLDVRGKTPRETALHDGAKS